MSMLTSDTWLDPEPVGRSVGHCPHCLRDAEMTVHRLRSTMGLIPIPSNEVRACTLCQGMSRHEGTWSRLIGIAALAPLALVLGTAVAIGVYIIGSMATGEFSPGFAAVGLVLVAVPAFFGRRTVAGMLRLWRDRGLIPMEGLRTRL